MQRWTRSVIRHRRKVLLAWAVVLLLGLAGAANLGGLLTNRFSVPGSEAEKGLDVAKDRFGERGDGNFTLVFQATGAQGTAARLAAQERMAAERAAAAVKRGRAGPIVPAGRGLAYVQVTTPLENADAAKVTPKLRKAVGTVPGSGPTCPASPRSTTTPRRSTTRTSRAGSRSPSPSR